LRHFKKKERDTRFLCLNEKNVLKLFVSISDMRAVVARKTRIHDRIFPLSGD